MGIYLQGLIMGLAYVAPIGLQNLFVINTAATHKKTRAFLTALIVVFFDVSLAFACFFGIGAVIQQSAWLERAILCIGSIIVIYIGISLLKSKVTGNSETNVEIPLLKVITSACIVTWFNPQALIDGTMMLGAFRATLPDLGAKFFILGVASASILWFFGITFFIGLFRNKFNDKVLRIINLICGLIIVFYGCKLLYSFILML